MVPDVEKIKAILIDCLYRDEELSKDGSQPEGFVSAEVVMTTFGFHPGRIASHRAEIREQLDGLPEPFREDKGGGWSFLNACMNRDGQLWTGEHRMIDCLLALGVASGQAKILLPRKMWSVMPGGMPYFVVLTNATVTPAANAS